MFIGHWYFLCVSGMRETQAEAGERKLPILSFDYFSFSFGELVFLSSIYKNMHPTSSILNSNQFLCVAYIFLVC